MRLLLALYDPSHSGGAGWAAQWVWHHPEVRPVLLTALYPDAFDRTDKPECPRQLDGSDRLLGGCVTLPEGWCGLYRFFYGGLDSQRRHVFVLVCGFLPREEFLGRDWLPLLEHPHWQDLVERARGGTLPPPEERELVWETSETTGRPLRPEMARPAGHEALDWDQVPALTAMASSLPADASFHCRVWRLPDRQGGTLSVLSGANPGRTVTAGEHFSTLPLRETVSADPQDAPKTRGWARLFRIKTQKSIAVPRSNSPPWLPRVLGALRMLAHPAVLGSVLLLVAAGVAGALVSHELQSQREQMVELRRRIEALETRGGGETDAARPDTSDAVHRHRRERRP